MLRGLQKGLRVVDLAAEQKLIEDANTPGLDGWISVSEELTDQREVISVATTRSNSTARCRRSGSGSVR